MPVFTFNVRVHFGHGERVALAPELAGLGMNRPLFVTDRGVRAAGVFGLATECVGKVAEEIVFDETPPNPTERAVDAGYRRYAALGCDGVVGIGGGATLDLAKAIAVMCGDPAPLWEYCNRNPRPRSIVNPPPVVLMPTTAGSGSEVGRSAVIIFDNGIKAGVGCPTIVRAAICDPELTLSLPPAMTAATGMDALSHCVETYCSASFNPPLDAIALDGLRRLHAHIERATRDGTDREARWSMMMGALEGALCFGKGLGAVHSISHALGALGHHHGTLNALMLPAVIAFNAPVIGERLDGLCDAMGFRRGSDLASAFADLNRRLGLPRGLRALGVSEDQFDGIARAALADNAHKTNPRAVSHEEYLTLLHAAW